ncbi:MAG TPA: hypothetical protein VGR67_02575 [Candidatus Polarisedimenticolia bacterium]|nr:hypothetical protein [Candidatus Polarisedimenticolia bacterium]
MPFLAAVGVWLATTIALNQNRRTPIPLRLDAHPEDLAPVEAIRQARGPVLLGFGGRDPYLSPGQVEGLFREAFYPATLWVAQRAGHTDLFRISPKAYQVKMDVFIASSLGSPDRGCRG